MKPPAGKTLTLATALLLALTAFAGPETIPMNRTNPNRERTAATSRHQELAAASIFIDLHNDAITQIHEHNDDLSRFDRDALQMSWPRLQASGLKAAFFAAWVPKNAAAGHGDHLIELFFELVYRQRDHMALARSHQDLTQNAQAGLFSAFLAIEGGKAIGADLKNLDYYFNRGVRYLTLTWNESNLIADAAKDPDQPNHGLSDFGKKVVARMNELGMIVDVSHLADPSLADVLAVSQDPVIASHSNCRVLHPVERNLTDDQIRAVCAPGGVIGVNFHSRFLTAQPRAAVSDVADHIDHLVQTGGIGCVALGSDYDGRIRAPAGLEHVGKLEALTNELVRRGYTSQDIQKIYGENFLRLLRRVVDKEP